MELLFKDGLVLHSYPFRIVYTFTDSDKFNLKVAFSVSKRNFKKAVDRNRVKRLMKESYRTQQQILINELKETQKSIQIFFLFISKEINSFSEMNSKMQDALLKLKVKLLQI